ncbi:MAG: hypothetical protein AAF281_03365 [Pseudomonadota bacterium]
MMTEIAAAFRTRPEGWLADTFGLAAVCAVLMASLMVPALI